MSDEIKKLTARFVCCEKETIGVVTYRKFSGKSRSIKAFQTCTTWGLVTILAVFIPGAHFVLVPLGALATPVVTFLVWRKREQIVGGEGVCPMCGARILVGVMSCSTVLIENCSSCHRPLDIVLSTLP